MFVESDVSAKHELNEGESKRVCPLSQSHQQHCCLCVHILSIHLVRVVYALFGGVVFAAPLSRAARRFVSSHLDKEAIRRGPDKTKQNKTHSKCEQS